MKLLQGIKSFVARRLSIRDTAGWSAPGDTSGSGEIVTHSSALALSTVWGCVNLLAGTAGSLPVEVRKEVDGVSVPATDHPLYRILHDSPNADQTALDYWEFISASLELHGDGISRKIKEGSRLVGLAPVRADLVDRRRLPDGRIGYRWSEGNRQFDLTEDDVLHIRGFGGGPLGGMSTLQFARQSFGLAQAIDRSAGSVFRNGMQPSGALTFKEFLTSDQRETAESKLVDRFVGARNSGRPMVLEGGAEWRSFSINPDDAQMLEARRFSVEEICRFFGVPPHMVGHTEKSTSWGSGLEQQTLAFVKFTLRRRLKRIEQAVEKQLLTPADRARGVKVRFNLEGLLRGDSVARAKFYKSALADGWATINEVRALEGKGPVPGGDIPRIQKQNVPITEAGNDQS